MSNEEYKEWLQRKLEEHHIGRPRLVATIIVVERALGHVMSDIGSRRRRPRPYYKLFNEDGTPTRAWVHAAELVLWLKYNDFRASPYVEAISTHPTVRRFLGNKKYRNQIPLNILFPAARKSTERLKEYSRHVKTYYIKH
jgi:hypothetical protein